MMLPAVMPGSPILQRHVSAFPLQMCKWSWCAWISTRMKCLERGGHSTCKHTYQAIFLNDTIRSLQRELPFKTNDISKKSNQIKMGLITTLTSLARTWEYSMSSSYRVSMWSLVNAIGTKRMFFLPLLQSPLMASSVWGPSQGIGPTYEKAGGGHTGTVSHHSPLHRTHAHTHIHAHTLAHTQSLPVRMRAMLYTSLMRLVFLY